MKNFLMDNKCALLNFLRFEDDFEIFGHELAIRKKNPPAITGGFLELGNLSFLLNDLLTSFFNQNYFCIFFKSIWIKY